MKGLGAWPGLLLCLMLAFGAAASLSAVAQGTARPGPIRIAVEGAYPPFNFIDQNNELQGFEVDLAKALCERMGAECVLVQHEWDGIVRGSAQPRLRRDHVVAGNSRPAREAHRVLEALLPHPGGLHRSKDSEIKALTPRALAGLKIGATMRSDHADYLEQPLRGIGDAFSMAARSRRPSICSPAASTRSSATSRRCRNSSRAARANAAASSATRPTNRPIPGQATGSACARRTTISRTLRRGDRRGAWRTAPMTRIRAKYFAFDIR